MYDNKWSFFEFRQNVCCKFALYYSILLTLSAHALEGYSSHFVVCLSVCLPVADPKIVLFVTKSTASLPLVVDLEYTLIIIINKLLNAANLNRVLTLWEIHVIISIDLYELLYTHKNVIIFHDGQPHIFSKPKHHIT